MTLGRLPSPRGTSSRRVILNLADQSVSSGCNVALALIVVHSVDAATFGGFAILLGVYALIVRLGQALIGEPLLVRYPGSLCDRDLAGTAIAAGLTLGVLAGVLVMVGGAFAPSSLQHGMFVLAFSLPGLVVQDTLRYVAFARLSPGTALVNDTIWAGVQLLVTLLILSRPAPSLAFIIAGWALSGSVAALVMLLASRTRIVRGGRWYRRTGDLGRRFAIEGLASVGTFQLVIFGTGAVAGLPAAGALRLAQTLLGPIGIAYSAGRVFLLPRLARHVQTNQSMWPDAVRGSLIVTLVPLLVLGAIMVTPTIFLRSLIGPSLALVLHLMPLVFAQKFVICLGLGAIAILRAQHRSKETQSNAIATATITVCLAAVMLYPFGAVGAAAALAIGSFVGAVALWRSALRDAS